VKCEADYVVPLSSRGGSARVRKIILKEADLLRFPCRKDERIQLTRRVRKGTWGSRGRGFEMCKKAGGRQMGSFLK